MEHKIISNHKWTSGLPSNSLWILEYQLAPDLGHTKFCTFLEVTWRLSCDIGYHAKSQSKWFNCRCKEPSQTYVKVECIKMEALSSIKECRHDEWEFWEPDLKKSQLAAEITTRSCCLPSSDDNIPVTWSCMTLQNLTSTDHGTHNNSSKPTEPQDTFLMRFTSCTTPTTSYPC